MSTLWDTDGDVGSETVMSARDGSVRELEELRTPRRKVVVGVQSAAGAWPRKYRGCATEALAAAAQQGLRGGCWP